MHPWTLDIQAELGSHDGQCLPGDNMRYSNACMMSMQDDYDEKDRDDVGEEETVDDVKSDEDGVEDIYDG